MCKFLKNVLKVVAVVAAIAGVAAVVFHFLQKKEEEVDETIDSLDELLEEIPLTEDVPEKKASRKDRWEKRNYITIPFHQD